MSRREGVERTGYCEQEGGVGRRGTVSRREGVGRTGYSEQEGGVREEGVL